MYKKNSRGIFIEKLNRTNHHKWKQKIEPALMNPEADEVVDEESPHAKETKEYREWNKRDKLSRAVIGLSVPYKTLENVRNYKIAKQMLSYINDIFRCRNLLNNIRARRDFHTVEMK